MVTKSYLTICTRKSRNSIKKVKGEIFHAVFQSMHRSNNPLPAQFNITLSSLLLTHGANL